MTAVKPSDRIGELDVLRGFALLGVFIVHFVGLTFYEIPAPADTRELWESDWVQRGASLVSDVFFQNKANTLFATLFGMSFWLMLERLEVRGGEFKRVYLRRLAALAAIGLVHLLLVFPGDVLFEYACLGFVLFSLRRLQAHLMLGLGLLLAIFGDALGTQISEWVSPVDHVPYSAAVPINERYSDWVLRSARQYYAEEIAYGGSLGWLLYLLGRFLIGAWLMQQSWVRRLGEHGSAARGIVGVSLPIGCALETVSILVMLDWLPWPAWIDTVCHAIGAPLMAIGYAAGLVALYTGGDSRRWVSWLSPVGRIALTAYVAHGLVFSLVFLPMGISFAGQVTPFMGLLLALGLYSALTLWSQFWLRHYRYGPLEYLWRWATYGSRPTNRLSEV